MDRISSIFASPLVSSGLRPCRKSRCVLLCAGLEVCLISSLPIRLPLVVCAEDTAFEETSGIDRCGFDLAKGSARSCGSPKSVKGKRHWCKIRLSSFQLSRYPLRTLIVPCILCLLCQCWLLWVYSSILHRLAIHSMRKVIDFMY
jgi:hypothetical protein